MAMTNNILDNTESIEHTSQQSFDDINDETSDKQEIEISVIQKRFSVKDLKKICQNYKELLHLQTLHIN